MSGKQPPFSLKLKLKQIWENLSGFAQRRSPLRITFRKKFQKKIRLTAMVCCLNLNGCQRPADNRLPAIPLQHPTMF